MTTTITRTEIFTMAWKSAKARRDQFATIRAAFSDALRRIWALVKLQAQIWKETPAPAPKPVMSGWAKANPYRAAAVANRQARMGSFAGHAGW